MLLLDCLNVDVHVNVCVCVCVMLQKCIQCLRFKNITAIPVIHLCKTCTCVCTKTSKICKIHIPLTSGRQCLRIGVQCKKVEFKILRLVNQHIESEPVDIADSPVLTSACYQTAEEFLYPVKYTITRTPLSTIR